MIIQTPPDLRVYAFSLDGFGAVNTIIADVGFREGWAFDNWMGAQGWQDANKSVGVSYSPPSSTLVTTAQRKWSELRTAADMGDMGLMSQLDTILETVRSLAAQADSLVTQHSFGNYSKMQRQEQVRVFTAINNELRKLSSMTVPVQTQPQPQPQTQTQQQGIGYSMQDSKPQQTQTRQLTSSSAALTQAKPGIPLWVWIASGLGVVGLGAAAFFVLKKPKPALAGYRRKKGKR